MNTRNLFSDQFLVTIHVLIKHLLIEPIVYNTYTWDIVFFTKLVSKMKFLHLWSLARQCIRACVIWSKFKNYKKKNMIETDVFIVVTKKRPTCKGQFEWNYANI